MSIQVAHVRTMKVVRPTIYVLLDNGKREFPRRGFSSPLHQGKVFNCKVQVMNFGQGGSELISLGGRTGSEHGCREDLRSQEWRKMGEMSL